METLIFIGLRVLVLLFAAVVFFGYGALLCWRDLDSRNKPTGLRFGLISATGLGVFIVLVQVLAIFWLFNIATVSVLAVLGGGISIAAFRKWRTSGTPYPAFSPLEKMAYVVLVAVALRTVLAPFAPATSWDEVMYHLPHALQWAENGGLSVNNWLRFPWFPYNYDLLYAVALLFRDEVFAHLLHAYAGWLCGLVIYHAVRRFADRLHAATATTIWLYLSGEFYGTAMIELGLSLFVFTACVAFWQWTRGVEENRRWLYLAAFLLGVAAGSKYLPLVYLPLFAGGLLLYERRLATLAWSALCFLLPCAYWYLRNLILTGDPFNPFGGPLFGYYDWNAADIAGQFIYTRSRSGWPPWLLWPALLGLFLPGTWKEMNWRFVGIFSAWALIAWYVLTGGYVRFLVPAYPVLSILAARGWIWLFAAIREKTRGVSVGAGTARQAPNRAVLLLMFALILTAAGFSADKLARDWNSIQVTETQRNAYLRETITGFDVADSLFEISHSGIYQFGLEDVIYYMPQPVWGDHFGPARYSDMAALSAGGMANALRSMDIDILVINQSIWPHIHSRDGFPDHFEEITRSGTVVVYRVRQVPWPAPAPLLTATTGNFIS